MFFFTFIYRYIYIYIFIGEKNYKRGRYSLAHVHAFSCCYTWLHKAASASGTCFIISRKDLTIPDLYGRRRMTNDVSIKLYTVKTQIGNYNLTPDALLKHDPYLQCLICWFHLVTFNYFFEASSFCSQKVLCLH